MVEGGKKITWVVLGLIAAAALAVFGGMMLGEFAGLSQGEVKAVSSSGEPSSAPSPNVPEPAAPETEPVSISDELPSLSIATSLAPNSGIRPIGEGEWVMQDDLPRELFRGENVSGIIAAYLAVIPDGSVTRCTVGNSSEVEPAQFLRPAAVGVCRALRERARFEPFSAPPVAAPEPAAPKQQAGMQQQPVPETPVPADAPDTERDVFVRVAFRMENLPAATALPE